MKACETCGQVHDTNPATRPAGSCPTCGHFGGPCTHSISARTIEKLKAIGYTVIGRGGNWVIYNHNGLTTNGGADLKSTGSEESAYRVSREHAQSPSGMKATMADKVRWLQTAEIPGLRIRHLDAPYPVAGQPGRWAIHAHTTVVSADLVHTGDEYGEGASPEAAVDALFWKVP